MAATAALGLLTDFANLALQVYEAVGDRRLARSTLRKLLKDYEVCCRLDSELIDRAMTQDSSQYHAIWLFQHHVSLAAWMEEKQIKLSNWNHSKLTHGFSKQRADKFTEFMNQLREDAEKVNTDLSAHVAANHPGFFAPPPPSLVEPNGHPPQRQRYNEILNDGNEILKRLRA